MSYQVSSGINEKDLASWLSKAKNEFGQFKDGRVDYTNAEIAPVVMCSVVFGEKLLIVKRAYGLADAEGYWSTVNGFIDQIKPIKDQVKQEIKEELDLTIVDKDIRVGKSYTIKNQSEKRSYIVFPCLVSLKAKTKITLNEENTEYKWIDRPSLDKHKVLDDLPLAIDSALRLI